jgi:hypothetical protein
VERWFPTSGRLRVAVSTAALVMGIMLTAGLVWVGTRVDSLIFLANMGTGQARLLLVGFAQDAALAIVGEPTLTTLGLSGTRRIWFTAALLGGSALISTIGLRVLATAARRGRN